MHISEITLEIVNNKSCMWIRIWFNQYHGEQICGFPQHGEGNEKQNKIKCKNAREDKHDKKIPSKEF